MADTGKGRVPINSAWDKFFSQLHKDISWQNKKASTTTSAIYDDWFFKAASGATGNGGFNYYYCLLAQACRSGYNV